MLKIKTEGGVRVGFAKTTREAVAKAKGMLRESHLTCLEVVNEKGQVTRRVEK